MNDSKDWRAGTESSDRPYGQMKYIDHDGPALQEFKDEMLANFAEVSESWFWEMNEDLRFTWFSRNVEERTGFLREWYYGKTRAEIGAPDEAAEVWAEHLETLRRHEPFKDFVYRRVGSDGDKWLTSSGAPIVDAEGRFRGYRGTGADVSSLTLARREAEWSAELLDQAVDGMNELFILCDSDDRIVMYNQSFREINALVMDRVRPGMKFEEFVRLIIAEGVTPESIGREDAYLQERMGYHNNPGQSFITRRGRDRWLLVRDQRTKNGGTIVISTDITEQVEIESRLRDAIEQVQFANRAKTEFLANMSHEIRTPLNSIIGFSDILLNEYFGTLGSDRYVQYSGHINKAGQHLLELIGDILDVSKIETGKIELDEEVFEVAPLVEDCRVIVQPRASQSAVGLKINISETVGPIHADPLRIKQILINLLENAIRFSEVGGEVFVDVDGGGEKPTCFTIRDEGIGIAEHNVPRVIEPFFQVIDFYSSGKREGSGLGLTLVKAFAENHDGRFLIASELGVGTRVCLELPAHRNISSPSELSR